MTREARVPWYLESLLPIALACLTGLEEHRAGPADPSASRSAVSVGCALELGVCPEAWVLLGEPTLQ